jgi:hypothetical protein
MPDFTPFITAFQILLGFIAFLFAVLSLVPGASTQQLGKTE